MGKAQDPSTTKKPPKKKKRKQQKQKPGRKGYYEILDIPSKLDAIRGWCKQGSTDAEIMQMLGVSKDTFYKWKKEKPEFADAIKRGKVVANGELLNAAFKQATGYYVPVDIVVKLKKPVLMGGEPVFINGEPVIVDGKPLMKNQKIYYEEVAESVPSTNYIPPNSTMGIFMVKNRMPEDYKDKHEVDVNGKVKLEDFFNKENGSDG